MTGGVLMSKNNLLLGFILGVLGTFFFRQERRKTVSLPVLHWGRP